MLNQTPFDELFKQALHDASLLLGAIFVILILAYLVDFWLRWHEIGRKYR